MKTRLLIISLTASLCLPINSCTSLTGGTPSPTTAAITAAFASPGGQQATAALTNLASSAATAALTAALTKEAGGKASVTQSTAQVLWQNAGIANSSGQIAQLAAALPATAQAASAAYTAATAKGVSPAVATSAIAGVISTAGGAPPPVAKTTRVQSAYDRIRALCRKPFAAMRMQDTPMFRTPELDEWRAASWGPTLFA